MGSDTSNNLKFILSIIGAIIGTITLYSTGFQNGYDTGKDKATDTKEYLQLQCNEKDGEIESIRQFKGKPQFQGSNFCQSSKE
jgi:hypothetical protein